MRQQLCPFTQRIRHKPLIPKMKILELYSRNNSPYFALCDSIIQNTIEKVDSLHLLFYSKYLHIMIYIYQPASWEDKYRQLNSKPLYSEGWDFLTLPTTQVCILFPYNLVQRLQQKSTQIPYKRKRHDRVSLLRSNSITPLR